MPAKKATTEANQETPKTPDTPKTPSTPKTPETPAATEAKKDDLPRKVKVEHIKTKKEHMVSLDYYNRNKSVLKLIG